jgi:hypothetical protein
MRDFAGVGDALQGGVAVLGAGVTNFVMTAVVMREAKLGAPAGGGVTRVAVAVRGGEGELVAGFVNDTFGGGIVVGRMVVLMTWCLTFASAGWLCSPTSANKETPMSQNFPRPTATGEVLSPVFILKNPFPADPIVKLSCPRAIGGMRFMQPVFAAKLQQSSKIVISTVKTPKS